MCIICNLVPKEYFNLIFPPKVLGLGNITSNTSKVTKPIFFSTFIFPRALQY